MLAPFVVFASLFLLMIAALLVRKNHNILSLSQKNSALLFCFCVVPVICYGLFFVGFRPLDAGFDTPVYLRAYNNIGGLFGAHARGVLWYGNTELLWWPFQSLIGNFLGGRAWLVFNYLITCLVVFVSYLALSRHYKINPMIFSFVLLTFYFVYMGNGIRQALALPIAFFAMIVFFEKKYIKALFCIFLSVGLHWSSVVFLLVPLFRLPLFKKDWVYLAVPFSALACSVLIGGVASWVVGFLGVDAFSVKYELYFSSARESHIGYVWKTFNFWVCTFSTVIFLLVCRPSYYESKVIHCYLVLFISLIFFGVNIPDFSERFMPAILLVLPAVVVLMLDKLKVRSFVKNYIFMLGFLLMGIAIFFNKSAQLTLGYNL